MKKHNWIIVLGAIVSIAASCERGQSAYEPTPLELNYPSHFPSPDLPAGNPLTQEGVRLGRHLFYDDRLSGDNTQNCGSCHLQESNFAEPYRFSTGIDGIEGSINAMVLSNMAWQQFFFWDGRENTLEEQVKDPVVNPIEMHSQWPDVIEKLAQDQRYLDMYADAFGDEQISEERTAKALAQFIYTLVSGQSKLDAYIQGNYIFTPSEQLGFDIFNNEQGDCFHCHGLATTGYQMGAYGLLQFSNNGLDSVLVEDSGREGYTGLSSDRAKFKIPSLRNVEYSFPYMHDGRFQTLAEVVDFYNTGGFPSATIDPNMKASGIGRNWSIAQKQGLVDFLKTFSDPKFLTDTAFSNLGSMRELYKMDTFLDMLDPIKGGYRCVYFDAAVVDRFPKGRKTRIILRVDDFIELQCGLQSNGDGRCFSIIGRNKLQGHTYEFGQPISVVVYEDPNQLGVEIPEVLSELIVQDEIIERVWKLLTDGRKRTLCHTLHRIKSVDKQVSKAMNFLEEEREKLAERGKW